METPNRKPGPQGPIGDPDKGDPRTPDERQPNGDPRPQSDPEKPCEK